jgi:hypothetical protein
MEQKRVISMAELKMDKPRDLGAVFEMHVKDGEEFIVCVC